MLIGNSRVDLCDDAMAATDKANLATSRAEDTGSANDHDRAMKRHTDAADMHEEASDERDGEGATVHSSMAKLHRGQASRHEASRDYLLNDDSDTDLDPSDDSEAMLPEAVQNRNLKRRNRMPSRQLITNREAEQTLAYYRTQGIGAKAYEQILRRVRAQQGMTANCACEGDLLHMPTTASALGIPEPVSNTVPIPGELKYDGISDDPSVMIAPTINFENRSSFAGHTGRNMQGG